MLQADRRTPGTRAVQVTAAGRRGLEIGELLLVRIAHRQGPSSTKAERDRSLFLLR